MADQDVQTVHGCACVIGTAGLLIRGPSGSGKSTLCLALISSAEPYAGFAQLVGDDRIFLDRRERVVIARVPDALFQKAELAGHGVVEMPALRACRIDLVVDIVKSNELDRSPEPGNIELVIEGGSLEIPCIKVPRHNITVALPLVRAKLSELNFRLT